jgi:hypothetical protein
MAGQLKTVDGENVDGKKLINVWLSDAAGGALCTVAPSRATVFRILLQMLPSL